MKWYVLYGSGAQADPADPGSAWTLLPCNTEIEALALSCRLLTASYIVREIGVLDRDTRARTLDAAAILRHCASTTSEDPPLS